MNKDSLIAKQALEIEQYKAKAEEVEVVRYDIHRLLHDIGAPLNGSRLKYTEGQLKPFFDIAKRIEDL